MIPIIFFFYFLFVGLDLQFVPFIIKYLTHLNR